MAADLPQSRQPRRKRAGDVILHESRKTQTIISPLRPAHIQVEGIRLLLLHRECQRISHRKCQRIFCFGHTVQHEGILAPQLGIEHILLEGDTQSPKQGGPKTKFKLAKLIPKTSHWAVHP